MSAAAFLEPTRLLAGGPARFNLAVHRLLLHLGFDDIRIIDGAGDGGGDILAHKANELFVFQCKWTTTAQIGRAAVDEVEAALARYAAQRAVVVTNSKPDGGAAKRAAALAAIGSRLDFWTGLHLARLSAAIPHLSPFAIDPRLYQTRSVLAIERDLAERKRALLILATGLGKTVVGGEVVRRRLSQYPQDCILIVASMKELVRQLEVAFWRHLPKSVPTQVLTGDEKPASLDGVTFATIESAERAVFEGYRPALIMVDESHHVSEEGYYNKLLTACASVPQFGVTATPWRGDKFDISDYFGEPSFKMGIAEGMAAGYLAQVDYRVFVDNVDWDVVKSVSKKGYTVKELNSRLFLPQRDEAILELVWETWSNTRNPRAILFCKSVKHAEAMADLMARYSPAWERAACLHTDMPKRERETVLSSFRSGRIPVLTAVDILNEGVDVPDVNIIGFLRVTHSRRIFVQQLGRGLRLREGKERVHVLDFVTDIRRIAALISLRRELGASREDPETLMLKEASEIRFSDESVGSLMEAWIKDAADVETAMEESRLQFPEF